MADWNGVNRRNGKTEHDLLIRIDSNLKNLINNFSEHKETVEKWQTTHKAEDDYRFTESGIRMAKLERNQNIAIGAILIIQIMINIFVK